MKKTFIVLILLLTAVSAFALSAKVLDVVGKVEYQEADGSWAPVSVGVTFGPGTVVSTGFKSEAVISVDETTVTIKALTRLTIEKLYEQEGNKSSSFYLDAGSLGADVKSAADKKVSFKVKTPAVTASVRGTAGNLSVRNLVGTAGTWLLSPPEPKTISYNRGDAPAASTEEKSTEPAAPAAAEAAESGEASAEAAEESGESDDFDWSIGNGEVTVKPGQEASFSVGQEIVTPMETAASAATSTGGTQTLSAKESVASGSSAAAATSSATSILQEIQSALSDDLVVTQPKPVVPTPAPVNPDPVNPDPVNPNPPVNPPTPPASTGGISVNIHFPTYNGGGNTDPGTTDPSTPTGPTTGTLTIQVDWGN